MNIPTKVSHLPPHLTEIVPHLGFQRAKVLIIGDLMLDHYIDGEVNRISPEAPVPVVVVGNRRNAAGGAANVAANVAGLGAIAIPIGVVGHDASARNLIDLLKGLGVDCTKLVTDQNRATTCKTRVTCGSHQIVRFDDETTTGISEELEEEILGRVRISLDDGVTAIILSDYAKGVLSKHVVTSVIREATPRGIPVVVDPKRADYSPYTSATCITPNLKEFQAAIHRLGALDEPLLELGESLRQRLKLQLLLVTQGAAGMTLFTSAGSFHFEAIAEEVFDVSGAGDTVIATFATALGQGIDPLAAAELSNIAASVVVRKSGTVPIHWNEIVPPVEALDPLAVAQHPHSAS